MYDFTAIRRLQTVSEAVPAEQHHAYDRDLERRWLIISARELHDFRATRNPTIPLHVDLVDALNDAILAVGAWRVRIEVPAEHHMTSESIVLGQTYAYLDRFTETPGGTSVKCLLSR